MFNEAKALIVVCILVGLHRRKATELDVLSRRANRNAKSLVAAFEEMLGKHLVVSIV